jgi:hypothetical protein
MHPEVYHLARVGWQFFGTLTFKQERLPERVRRKMWCAFVRALAGKLRVHFDRVLWVLRAERGERFGRSHYHYLIGGLPPSCVSPAWCFIQAAAWESLGGGMARVYVFDQSLNGLDYITKSLDAGLAHESGKFGAAASDLTLSHSTTAFLRGCVQRDRQAFSSPQPVGHCPPDRL